MSKIILENLNKYYNKGRSNELHVINNTSLEFDETGFVCLLGESGSGKTTLLNVMSGIDRPNSGKVTVDGVNVLLQNDKSAEIRNISFGYVFQNYYMINDDTVYENLKLALAPYHLSDKAMDERIDYVLDAVQMSRYKKRIMNQLSGGQAQRIAIARALVKSPNVIFADEPTGNLDESTTLRIMTILKNISKTCLVIVATHEKRIAEFFANRIIKISDGKVIDDRRLEQTDKIYDTVDDHNLYLAEYDRYTLRDDSHHNVDIYQNDLDDKVDFSVIIEHGKYYIKADDPNKFQVILPESNIQAINSARPVMDMSKVDKMEYELKKPEKKNNGVLSWKELFRKVTTSVKSKSFYIMIIALIMISGLSVFAVGDYLTISQDNLQEELTTDSRTAVIKFKKNTNVSLLEFRNSITAVVKDLEAQIPNSYVYANATPVGYFNYVGFTEIENTVTNTSTLFNGFDYVPLDYLDESTITYGRKAESMYEIVVDEWVLDKFMSQSNIASASMKKYSNFIGKQIFYQSTKTSVTIVGVCKSNQMSVYIDEFSLMNIYSSNYNISSLSYLKQVCDDYDSIKLTENQIMVSSNVNIRNAQTQTINDVVYDVYDIRYNSEVPTKLVLSDEGFRRLMYTEYTYDSCIRIIMDDKTTLEEYVKRFNDENDEFCADLKTSVYLDYYDNYKSTSTAYYAKLNKKIVSRAIVTAMIFAMCIATLFITMKAHAAENMQTTMVYRLLGLKKRVVISIYAVEILIVSVIVMIPTSLIVTGILKFVAAMPASTFKFELTIPAYFLTLAALVVLDIIVGILPIMLIMRKTPARLVAEYDL